MGSNKAWDRFESDLQGLAGELKRRYRDAGDTTGRAEVKRSLEQLRSAADTVFKSLENASRDANVRSKTKEAARSFGMAVAETFRDVSDEIEKKVKKP